MPGSIPNGTPGQVVTVQLDESPAATGPGTLALATAKSPAERPAVIAAIRANARTLRELLKDKLPLSTDELYNDDGLPE